MVLVGYRRFEGQNLEVDLTSLAVLAKRLQLFGDDEYFVGKMSRSNVFFFRVSGRLSESFHPLVGWLEVTCEPPLKRSLK